MRLSGDIEAILLDEDPNAISVCMERGREVSRIAKMKPAGSMDEVSGTFDVAVFSSTSEHRFGLLKNFLSVAEAHVLLLEKLLAPTSQELQMFKSLDHSLMENCYVNLPTPYFTHFINLTDGLIEEEGGRGAVRYEVRGKGLGLVTNAVHLLDHFIRLCQFPSVIELRLSESARWHPSKRKGYVEISGYFEAETRSGDIFRMEDAHHDQLETFQIEISSGKTSWFFDEVKGLSTKYKEGEPVRRNPYDLPLQSALTHLSVERFQSGLRPNWASLDEALAVHELIFKAIDNVFPPDLGLRFS